MKRNGLQCYSSPFNAHNKCLVAYEHIVSFTESSEGQMFFRTTDGKRYMYSGNSERLQKEFEEIEGGK